MKLIIGLGNVGKQYHATRHNLGFAVVDVLAITFGQPGGFKKHSRAASDILDLKASHGCILAKPTTMMNLSGQAVGELLRFYKVEPKDVWVIYDDLDLQFGQMRVRVGGGSAGHNGVKSIIQHISEDFWRVRLGIQNQYLATTPTDKFVLDPFTAEEAPKVPAIVESAANEVESALLKGELTDHTLNLI
ncbi:MAG TPA: aminoacyl-tRNA hydrolase [Candidatus Saccharimonadales bacterium]|nr:aminoacyl-tRNA hydrolase [Candidatus Saccharimonadales bacterium]